MRTYGWTENYCLDELDGAKSWVWGSYALQSQASVWGTGVKIVAGGYVAAEREKIKATKQNV